MANTLSNKTMNRCRLPVLLTIYVHLFCMNAPRDNIYDPGNPDKPAIYGSIMEPDSTLFSDCVVELLKDNKIVLSDTSDSAGRFELIDIPIGVYDMAISSPQFYNPISVYSESLWAGVHLFDYDVFFTTLHFDNDIVGNTEPYSFSFKQGDWTILEDMQMSGQHSIPNVYCGENNPPAGPAIVWYRRPTESVFFDISFKVLASSGGSWQTGILFRYQDNANYYMLEVASDSVLLRWKENGVDSILLATPHNFSIDRWHSIGIDCDSNLTNVYFDKELTFPFLTSTIRQGRFGIFVANRDNDATTVYFDDVVVRFQ